MISAAKAVLGLLVTLLLGFAAHSWLGLGGQFVDRLESRAVTAVGHAGGVGIRVQMIRDPALTRTAVLSGTADGATRDRLLVEVRSVPGIAAARWQSAVDSTPLLLEILLLLGGVYAIGVALGGFLWRRSSV